MQGICRTSREFPFETTFLNIDSVYYCLIAKFSKSLSNRFLMNSGKKNSSNFKKRAPPRSFTRKNDVYVTNKTDFRATLKKCEGLLNSEEGECFLHCIGNAINRGINLALKLSEEYNFQFEANTSTINLVGKLNPLSPEKLFVQCVPIYFRRPPSAK